MHNPLVEYFIRYVLQTSAASEHSFPPDSTAHRQNPASYAPSPTCADEFLGRDLYGLMCRVISLHFQSREAPGLSGTTISQAIAIWSDLDALGVADAPPTAYHEKVHWLYVSALYIWLHCIIYPDSLGGEKVQSMVMQGLPTTADFTFSPELSEALLVPLFFFGVASVRREERDLVNQSFRRLEKLLVERDLGIFEGIVRWTWTKYNDGAHRSWDWADWNNSIDLA